MRGSSRKAFFDTNVLLYMYSDSDTGKQARARELFAEYATRERAIISTQVVEEFWVNGCKKLRGQIPEVRAVVSKLLDLPMVILSQPHILRAMDNQERYQISFWDGLILAAAESGGAEILLTEDLNHGQQYGAVLAQNPFHV
jgi:predicted nucleic acid-binding protein